MRSLGGPSQEDLHQELQPKNFCEGELLRSMQAVMIPARRMIVIPTSLQRIVVKYLPDIFTSFVCVCVCVGVGGGEVRGE